jgi:hypothetical protein
MLEDTLRAYLGKACDTEVTVADIQVNRHHKAATVWQLGPNTNCNAHLVCVRCFNGVCALRVVQAGMVAGLPRRSRNKVQRRAGFGDATPDDSAASSDGAAEANGTAGHDQSHAPQQTAAAMEADRFGSNGHAWYGQKVCGCRNIGLCYLTAPLASVLMWRLQQQVVEGCCDLSGRQPTLCADSVICSLSHPGC